MAEDEPTEDVEHVDATAMAWSSIGVLIFHRCISGLAIFIIREYDWKQGILQFFDVLLFVEIFETHKRLVENLASDTIILTINSDSNNQNDAQATMSSIIDMNSKSNSTEAKDQDYNIKIQINSEAIDPSLRFKYLRSFEALFEAAPQAVVQLVYVMRTKQIEEVFILSIFQSIVSMTNSMVNEDNAYMAHPKWKNYKKRLPIPHVDFLRHAFFRASEITCRIGLFSLFWTVAGGVFVALMLIPCELSFPFLYNGYLYYHHRLDWHQIFIIKYHHCFATRMDF